MHRETRQFGDGHGGRVTGITSYPDHHRATNATAVVLAHGAGTDMTNPLLVAILEALARHGYPSVRFNFPYKELGRRAPDPLPVLKECFRSVIAEVRATPQLSPGKLFIGGKSLGGRVASYLQAEGVPVSGLLFLGYPLHPAGKPERLRVDHLARITVPMLFLVGPATHCVGLTSSTRTCVDSPPRLRFTSLRTGITPLKCSSALAALRRTSPTS